MKNSIIKFLVTTLMLPILLAISPVGIANKIHEIQHDSGRVAGAHHINSEDHAHSSLDHSSTPFTHHKSDHHLLILDLGTYFNEYLNVDLHRQLGSSIAFDGVPDDIGFLIPAVSISSSNLDYLAIQSQGEQKENPPSRSVLSLTKRLRI